MIRLRILGREVFLDDVKCNHRCPSEEEADWDFTQKRKTYCDPGDRDFSEAAMS